MTLIGYCRRGHVCMIPGSKEFFIAAIDHKEWGTAHTVWGVVSVSCIQISGMLFECWMGKDAY